jgi:hypothetical protein
MTYALDEENALLLRDWLSDMLAVVPVPVAVPVLPDAVGNDPDNMIF